MIKKLLVKLKSCFGFTISRKPKPSQLLFLYCECGNELCSDGSFISDTQDDNDDNHVTYKCKSCGLESDWNFDIAPFPVNWEELRTKK